MKNNEIKKLTEKYGVKPSKKLGQHFLTEEKYLKEIVKAADLKKGELVVEIGPGTGSLTEKLLKVGVKIIAIEKDKKLVSYLKEKFASQDKKIKIIEADFLKLNLCFSIKNKNYKIVSNIPYNITGKIIRKILELEKKPKLAVLAVQKEVGERIVKKSNKENLLSLIIQTYGQAEIAGVIPAGAFWPLSKVQSAILKINFYPEPKIKNPQKFIDFLKIGFSSPRKKVITNLSNALKIKKRILEKTFQKINLNFNSRAENLNFNDWQKLFKKISK